MCVFSFLRHLKGQREKNEIPNLLDKRPPTESLFCFFFLFPLTPPRGTRRPLPTQRVIGPRPISPFSLYTTSWHRAEVLDILPNRSPTYFFFLTPPRGTFCFSFVVVFFTPPRGAEQKSPTHCSSGPRPTFVFFFFPFLTPPRGTFSFFFCLHHLVAQSRSFRGITKTVHSDYEVR